jgi:acyl dehydratase
MACGRPSVWLTAPAGCRTQWRDRGRTHTGFLAPSHDEREHSRNRGHSTRPTIGEIIVQGGITSGILNAVVAEHLPGPGTVFLNVNWDFRAPVRPGDEITGAVEVLEAREDKPITKLRTTVVRQDGTVVLEGTAVCYTAAVVR